MIQIKNIETELRGGWDIINSLVECDETSKRIEELISNHLIKIATNETGWDILFQDPADSRYWELTYPHSEWHGGGPPLLKNLSKDEVILKYAPQVGHKIQA